MAAGYLAVGLLAALCAVVTAWPLGILSTIGAAYVAATLAVICMAMIRAVMLRRVVARTEAPSGIVWC